MLGTSRKKTVKPLLENERFYPFKRNLRITLKFCLGYLNANGFFEVIGVFPDLLFWGLTKFWLQLLCVCVLCFENCFSLWDHLIHFLYYVCSHFFNLDWLSIRDPRYSFHCPFIGFFIQSCVSAILCQELHRCLPLNLSWVCTKRSDLEFSEFYCLALL